VPCGVAPGCVAVLPRGLPGPATTCPPGSPRCDVTTATVQHVAAVSQPRVERQPGNSPLDVRDGCATLPATHRQSRSGPPGEPQASRT
jgi:hypothetical protein